MCGIEKIKPIGLLYGEEMEKDVRVYSDGGVGLGPLVSPEQADFPEAQCEAFWRMKQGPHNNESLLYCGARSNHGTCWHV
jgi:hypothetical protein